MSTKKVIIGCCGCTVILALLGAAAFLGFGSFTLNGDCVFKGPFASVSDGPCAKKTTDNNDSKNEDSNNPDNNGSTGSESNNSDNSGLSKYTSASGYSFSYPGDEYDRTIDNDGTIILTAKSSQGSINDNIRFFASRSSSRLPSINDSNCSAYSDALLSEYPFTIIRTQVDIVALDSGDKACQVSINSNNGVDDVFQFQYYVLGKEDRYYVITISSNADGSNLESMAAVVSSFDPVN